MSDQPLKTVSGGPPRRADRPGVEVAAPAPRAGGFVSFRYRSTEITSHGGRTRVKATQTSFDDGRLRTEEFEGELGPGAFDAAVRHAQQQLLGPTATLLRALAAWLPASQRRSDRG